MDPMICFFSFHFSHHFSIDTVSIFLLFINVKCTMYIHVSTSLSVLFSFVRTNMFISLIFCTANMSNRQHRIWKVKRKVVLCSLFKHYSKFRFTFQWFFTWCLVNKVIWIQTLRTENREQTKIKSKTSTNSTMKKNVETCPVHTG